MKKAKKFLVGLLAFASVSAFALGFTGCEDEKPSVGTGNGTNTEQGGDDTNEEVHTHVYLDLLNVNYIAQQATCTSGTIYYQSCACGKKGTETFEYGDPIAHEYDEQVATDEYFVSVANCYNQAQYYYSCECGAKGEYTFGYGEYAHRFDQEVLTRDYWYDDEDYYLASAGDCTHKATYYYSCACGAMGTETFEYGDYVHSWEEEYTISGNEHWLDCENCDETKENGTHVAMDDGYCVCNLPISTTVGIAYDLSSDGTYAEVIGYTGSSTRVIIADAYQNKPVKTIYDNAFKNTNISSVVIPDSVTTIGYSAFSSCASLERVTIGNSVTTIGDEAFYRCYSLTSVTIGNSVTTIGSSAFEYCRSLESVTIPDSVTTIGYSAFSSCASLERVTIGNSVTTIGSSAFKYCNSLERVTIGNSVTTIGSSAFYNCNSLTSITIPNSVTTIGSSAFYDCESLTSVTIGNSVTTIGDEAFYNCGSLAFTVYGNAKYLGNAENPYYALITTVSNSYSSYEIHSQTKIIADYAFYRCDRLTSVTIPNSVTTIGYSAFSSCASLTSVTIGNSVTTIGSSAFKYCNSLERVTIGNSVTTIGSSAFYDCDGLTSVTIPNSVTTIGYEAFYDCDSLTSVTIGNSVTTIERYAFCYCDRLTSVVFEDTSTWYITSNYEDWQNKVNGGQVDISDPATAADWLSASYYWWYKL